MAATASITKRGIYRPATSVIDALSPPIDVINVQLLNAVASTTQRIYLPSGMSDIRGIMAFTNGAVAIGVSTSRAVSVSAFCDGTNQFCVEQWVDSETGPLNMESIRNHNTITISRYSDNAPYTGAPTRGHTVTGFGAGYVDIQTTVDTSSAVNNFITIVAFGGPEVTSAAVWTKDDLGTGTSAVPVSGLGFEPSMTYIASVDESEVLANFDDVSRSARTESKYCFGFALNQTGNPQGCWGIAATHNEAEPVDLATVISNTKCLSIVTDAGALNYNVTCDNWVNGGFDLTPSSSAASAICGGMALEFSDDFKVEFFDVTIPTTGNYTQSTSGETLAATMYMMHGATAYDTATTASAMGEAEVFLSERETLSHTNTYISGINDNDGSARSRLQRELAVWEWDTTASQIVQSTSQTITNTNFSYVLGTNPTSEIIGIGLNFYT